MHAGANVIQKNKVHDASRIITAGSISQLLKENSNQQQMC